MKALTICGLLDRIRDDAGENRDNASAILSALCDGAYLRDLMNYYEVKRSTNDDDDITCDEKLFCALIETIHAMIESEGVNVCNH
jgi:hypothetical protein